MKSMLCSYCVKKFKANAVKHVRNPRDGKPVYDDEGNPWKLCKKCMDDFLLGYQIEAAFADRLSPGKDAATFVNKGDGEWEKIS